MSVEKADHYVAECVFRWILFSVLIVVFLPVLNIWYRLIVGLDISFEECMPDLSLVVLSVCCNLFSIFVDGKKHIYFGIRCVCGTILGIISAVCLMLFYTIRYGENSVLEHWQGFLIKASTIIIIVCFFVGIIIEVHSNIKDRRLERKRKKENEDGNNENNNKK